MVSSSQQSLALTNPQISPIAIYRLNCGLGNEPTTLSSSSGANTHTKEKKTEKSRFGVSHYYSRKTIDCESGWQNITGFLPVGTWGHVWGCW